MTSSLANLIFFGSDHFSCFVLRQMLEKGLLVKLIITTPPRPGGRGLKTKESPVAALAIRHGIPLIKPDNLRDSELLARLNALQADIFVIASYGKILPEVIIQMPKKVAINVHPSLLPRWRGPSPIQSAVLYGDVQTGVSIMRVARKVDAGAVLLQKRIPVEANVNALELEESLAVMGGDLVAEAVTLICDEQGTWKEQAEEEVTYSRRLTKEDGLVNWNRSSFEIHNQIRGLMPWPGAFTFFQRKRLRLLQSAALKTGSSDRKPGEIVEISKQGWMDVATGDGLLRLLLLQLEGKGTVSPYHFSLGYPIGMGQLLGEQS